MTSAPWPLPSPHDHMSNGHKYAVNHEKGHGRVFSTVTEAWTRSGTEAEPEQKNLAAPSRHLQYALSAANREPDYYSISWDIKLIMLVCVTWFARSKIAAIGKRATSDHLAPLPGNRHFPSNLNIWLFPSQSFNLSKNICCPRLKRESYISSWCFDYICFIATDLLKPSDKDLQSHDSYKSVIQTTVVNNKLW